MASIWTREDGGIAVARGFSIAGNVERVGDIAAFAEKASGEIAAIEHWQHRMHIARAILDQFAENHLPSPTEPDGGVVFTALL